MEQKGKKTILLSEGENTKSLLAVERGNTDVDLSDTQMNQNDGG